MAMGAVEGQTAGEAWQEVLDRDNTGSGAVQAVKIPHRTVFKNNIFVKRIMMINELAHFLFIRSC